MEFQSIMLRMLVFHAEKRCSSAELEKPRIWQRSYCDIPGLIPTLVKLSQKGVKSLLAILVSFVSEHIETLEEIDMKYRELALESGIQNWRHVATLNRTSSFIRDLADAVLEAFPSATAISSSRNISNEDDNDFVRYAVKLLFGSILAFVFLMLQKMILTFKNNLL